MKECIKRKIVYFSLSFIAVFFFCLYAYTFQDNPIGMNIWDHGPMNLEGREYEWMAKGKYSLLAPSSCKPIRHPLCPLLYPIINLPLTKIIPIKDSPLVCSFLGSISIAIFGFWLYRKLRKALIVLPVVFLMGFSFSTWYISSIWESRVLIFFSSVLILLAIDGLIKKPSFRQMLLASAATVVMLLSCLANLYNMVLVPAVLFLLVCIRSNGKQQNRSRSSLRSFPGLWPKISFGKALFLSIGYIGLTLAVVFLLYQAFAVFNPRLNIIGGKNIERKVIDYCEEQRKGRCSWNHFKKVSEIRNGIYESMLFSIGGLKVPGNVSIYRGLGKMSLGRNEWKDKDAILNYIYRVEGFLFIFGYLVLIIIILYTVFWKKLWLQEPLLLIIFFWIILTTVIMIYGPRRTTAVFPIELQPGIWTFCALTLTHLKSKIVRFFLILFVFIMAWNNFQVIDFFRDHYKTLALAPISPAINIGEARDDNLIYLEGATIKASSEVLSKGINKIIDNDPDTCWSGFFESPGEPIWILVDFGVRNRTRFGFLGIRPCRNKPTDFFQSARLQASNNGKTWKNLKDIQISLPPEELKEILNSKAIKLEDIRISLPPKNNNWRLWPLGNDDDYRYYRLLILSGYTQNNQLRPISIAEIFFY